MSIMLPINLKRQVWATPWRAAGHQGCGVRDLRAAPRVQQGHLEDPPRPQRWDRGGGRVQDGAQEGWLDLHRPCSLCHHCQQGLMDDILTSRSHLPELYQVRHCRGMDTHFLSAQVGGSQDLILMLFLHWFDIYWYTWLWSWCRRLSLPATTRTCTPILASRYFKLSC